MCGVLPEENLKFWFRLPENGTASSQIWVCKTVDNKKENSTINKQQIDNNLNNSPATAPKTLMCFKSFKFIIAENTNFYYGNTRAKV